MEVVLLLGIIIVTGSVLAWLEAPPKNPARYSGPVYDPQRPVIRRAGAVGYTGIKCPLCGKTTFGESTRCGACGRDNSVRRNVPTQSTARHNLVEKR